MRLMPIVPLSLLLVGCGSSPSDYDGSISDFSYGGSGYAYDEDEEDREPFDEDAARSAAEDELASEEYDYSYGCTDDCSGHEAGWQWRAENGYTPNSWSQSFNEGAYAYEDAVEARVEEMRDEYDAGYEPDY